MQKTIRRGDTKLAGYFALELFHSRYSEYCWKRLLTISAEDCHGETITTEIYNLYRSFRLINDGKKEEKGRIFISKAVIILCRALKNRDADVLQNAIYDQKMEVTDEEIARHLAETPKEELPVPDYAYDCHTRKGKTMGKTKKQFFEEEFKGLQPRQKGLFDHLHLEM
jgi:replication-associated recombination protein RarA